MKSLVYSESLKQSKELFELAQEAAPLLEEVLGQSANGVSAEWDCSKDTQGHDLLILRIADWNMSKSGVFAPSEMRDGAQLRWRLNRLWGDLLQIYSHKLLDQLLETGATQEN